MDGETESGEQNAAFFAQIDQKIDSIGKSAFREKLLMAILPVFVALVSVWLTHNSASKQLSLASAQLETTQNIEAAKLIAQYSEMILTGKEKEVQLAQIAFASVPMSKQQRQDIYAFLDRPSDNSASPGPTSSKVKDDKLAELLARIFSDDENVRKASYVEARQYITENLDEKMIASLSNWISNNEFNITGRSNVLSIVASMPSDKLKPYAAVLNEQLDKILALQGVNPAYAVGPQTKGWIDTIKENIQ